MTIPVLKPCPFCGNRSGTTSDNSHGVFCVYCTNAACSSDGPVADSAEQAIAAWNRRPSPADQRPVTCSACGGDGYYKGPRLGDEPCRDCTGTGQRPVRACELLGTWAADAVQIGEDGPECRACGCVLDNQGRGHSRCAVPVIEEALRLFDGQRARSRVQSFVAELAEEACEYGDGCPDFAGTRHGDCRPCAARKAIEADRASRSPRDGEGALPSDVAECRVCRKRFAHPAPGTGGTWTCSDECRAAATPLQEKEPPK